MRFHSQNLNEPKGKIIGSMFWHGRAWFYAGRDRYNETLHVEWLFGKYARDFAITATFGYGDSDAGVCLHVCIPWLFSFFLVVPHVYRCRESRTGIGIHNGGFWFYPFTDQHESRRDHPWWKKSYCWRFPWDFEHHLTEILKPLSGVDSASWPVVWNDRGGQFMDAWDERKAAEDSVSQVWDYFYTLKRGEVQKCRATIHVRRSTWRARWYPIIPSVKVCTSLDIQFSAEVGEETGSWKGGCVGCGYDMLPGEMPFDTLRRMEVERRF